MYISINDFTLFEDQTGGAFEQNFSKMSNAPGFARGAWAVLEFTGTLWSLLHFYCWKPILPSHCKKLHVFFLSTFSQKQGKFCFHNTRSCLISGNNISLIYIDAIAVFLNPLSSYTYQSLSKFIKI